MKSKYPMMLPAQQDFINMASVLKLKTTDRIVTYDRNGSQYACRVYWMFRIMGHTQIAVLNGGFKAWVAGDNSVESEAYNLAEEYGYKFNPEMYSTTEDILATVESNIKKTGDVKIIDARAAD